MADVEYDEPLASPVRVVFASEYDPCPECGETWCPVHRMHYHECPCLGPNEAEDRGYTLFYDKDGALYARPPKKES